MYNKLVLIPAIVVILGTQERKPRFFLYCCYILNRISNIYQAQDAGPAHFFLFGLCLVSSLIVWLMLFVSHFLSLLLSLFPLVHLCCVAKQLVSDPRRKKQKSRPLLGALQSYVAILPGT